MGTKKHILPEENFKGHILTISVLYNEGYTFTEPPANQVFSPGSLASESVVQAN